MNKFLFLFGFLFSFASFGNSSCGLNGTIEERIKDCRHFVGIKNEYALVVRTLEGHEVYKGLRTGVFWSADLKGQKNYYYDGVSTICNKDHPEFGGLKLKWTLPPVDRYLQGIKYGIQQSLPLMKKRSYWTSSFDSFYVNSRYIFEGDVIYTQNNRGLYTLRHLEANVGNAYVKCIVETIF